MGGFGAIIHSIRLKELIELGTKNIPQISETELSHKKSPEKWSKKEILGHLIDSAMHNLQRFTEIQFETKPYPVRKYKQNELVAANHYQQANKDELIQLWSALNKRLLSVMEQQREETLNYQIVISEEQISDFHFLMQDYVDHLEHHLRQIMQTSRSKG